MATLEGFDPSAKQALMPPDNELEKFVSERLEDARGRLAQLHSEMVRWQRVARACEAAKAQLAGDEDSVPETYPEPEGPVDPRSLY